MTLKNSFLVRVRENGRRRHWVWILCTLALFILLPLRLLTVVSGNMPIYKTMGPEYLKYMMRLVESVFIPNELMLILICAAAVLCGIQGYSYLFYRVKVDMYHSQPVSKPVRFFSIYYNGAAYFLLPYLVNVLLALGVAGYYQLLDDELCRAALLSAGFQMIAFLAVYHTVILAVMLTGNYLTCLLGIGTLLGIEWGCRAIFCNYCSLYFQTYSSKNANGIKSPLFSVAIIFLQALRNGRLYTGEVSCEWLWQQMGSYMLRITLIGLFTLLLAYLAYYYRAEESAGHSLVFGWMRPMVKLVAVLFVSLSVGWIMSLMAGKNLQLTIGAIVLGAVVTHCILQVIFEAHFKALLQGWWTLLAGTAAAFAVFACFHWDLTGYDTGIPRESSVESVAILFDAQLADQDYDERSYYKRHMFLTDYSQIEKLAAADFFHQDTGENLYEQQDINYNNLTVLYRMKNGKQKYRQYCIDMAAQKKLMQAILSDQAYKEGAFPILTEHYFTQAKHFTLILDSHLRSSIEIEPAHTARILKALETDLKNYDFEMVSQEVQLGRLRISVKQGATLDGDIPQTDFYPIYASYENTLQILQEKGYLDASIDVKSIIASLTVEHIVNSEDDSDAQFYTQTYTDPDDIAQILQSCDDTNYGMAWKDGTQYQNDFYIYGYTVSGTYVGFSLRKGESLPQHVAEKLCCEQ